MAQISRRTLLASAAVAAASQLKTARRGRAANGSDAGTVDSSPAHISVYQTPQTPNGVAGSLARLRQGSNGQTPTEKKFTAAWVESLAARGEPTVYTRKNSKDFAHIGMPIGGIGAGQLYLGGDGKLWWWDIFNSQTDGGSVGDYLNPSVAGNPRDNGQIVLAQGFAVRYQHNGKQVVRSLDKKGFADISFMGQYPIARVEYSQPGEPVKVSLEAFSPFIPLDLENSAYPAVMLNYTIANTGDTPLDCAIAGWMENPVCIKNRGEFAAVLTNAVKHDRGAAILESAAAPLPAATAAHTHADIVFEDFSTGTYKNWKVVGNAFGKKPSTIDSNPRASWDRPALAHTMLGKFMADSFHNHGNIRMNGDPATGKLVSRSFMIERPFINVHLAGGNHPGKTCVNLIIDGNVARTMSGRNSDSLAWQSWNVQGLLGHKAHIEIVDHATGGWGHIEVDRIVFGEIPPGAFGQMAKQVDFGTTALAVLGDAGDVVGASQINFSDLPAAAFANGPPTAHAGMQAGLIGSIGRSVTIAPGKSATVSFMLAWHFPNPLPLGVKTPSGRWYGTAFTSATQVVRYLLEHRNRLTDQTRLWRDTWYDSTLPHWLLERTVLNTGILSAATSYLLSDGRYYAWEGVYCCVGTCTHVYGYTSAPGCLFPVLEKRLREMADFNPRVGFNPDGGIGMRGEFDRTPAVDGQSGIILRTLRAHQMSADNAFLKRNYAAALKATEYLIRVNDPKKTGVLSGPQHNTLDAAWYGSCAWLSIFYQAALRAMATMADDMSDHARAAELRSIAARGRALAEKQLFNGQYFYQLPDKAHPHAVGSYEGCEIDQLLGQSLAYQAGLGKIIDLPMVSKALDSLWRYNFTTNVGQYRKAFPPGRWFAAGNDAGTIMCSWPLGRSKVTLAAYGYYFNECMSGFEHTLASLMIWHGFVDKGLAIIRAIHDRYAADKRNPFNEIECSGHYGRAMASYGGFIALCGFEHHGPRGYVAFAPRLSPENFRAAFTVTQGWGSYHQKLENGKGTAALAIKLGQLKLKTLSLQLTNARNTPPVHVSLAGRKVAASTRLTGDRLLVTLRNKITVQAGQELQVRIG